MIPQPFELLYPPKEIFLNEELASWDWTLRTNRFPERSDYTIDKQKGILYHRDKQTFKGFPFPPATDNVAIFKRALILELKDPLALIFYKRTIRKLEELASVSVRRYYLKPEMYCRSVKEIFRLVKLVWNETWAHTIASIFQWDKAYGWRVQNYAGRIIDKEAFIKNLRKGINTLLKFAEQSDNNIEVKKKWRQMKYLFNIAWFIPKFRRIIKKVAKEINLEEMRMDENDINSAFVK